MEVGWQHLWDFDISPENRLATINAGRPIKKNNRFPKKGGGHSEAEAVEETSEDIPEPVGEPVGEMVWWEYGLGPQGCAEKPASAKRRNRRQSVMYKQQEEPSDNESDCSDDGYKSNSEHMPQNEPGN